MRFRFSASRWVSVLLFVTLCAIIATWAMVLWAPRSPIAPTTPLNADLSTPDLGHAGQLFGGTLTASPEAGTGPVNIVVTGIVVGGAQSVALLAIDGQPAKPYAIGAQVTESTRLVAISRDSVDLERNGQPLRLATPPRASVDILTSGPHGHSAAETLAPVRTTPSLPPPTAVTPQDESPSGLILSPPAADGVLETP